MVKTLKASPLEKRQSTSHDSQASKRYHLIVHRLVGIRPEDFLDFIIANYFEEILVSDLFYRTDWRWYQTYRLFIAKDI